MAFSNYKKPTRRLEAASRLEGVGDVFITSINEQDINTLAAVYRDEMSFLFDLAMNGLGDEDHFSSKIPDLVHLVLTDLPSFAVDLIATAVPGGDDSEERAGIAAIPFTVKIDILSEILAFTIEVEGGLEKLKGLVGKAVLTAARPSPKA